MRMKDTAIIDFGSQKITVVVGKMAKSGSLNIMGSGESEYSGFLNGEFIEMDKLGSAIRQAIVIAENNSQIKITNMVLGIPASFCICMCKEIVQNYRKRTKIKPKVLNTLFELGNDFAKYRTHRVISATATYLELDDKTIVTEGLGMVTTKLKAKVSYILAENKFINEIEKLLNIIGIKVDDYICGAYAEADYLLANEARANAVIIDSGHITTSVCIVSGKGLLTLSEFALGGGFITSDLMKWLKLNYETAENLKRKAVLSISPNMNELYEVKSHNEVISLPTITTNEIISAIVEKIARTVLKCLDQNKSLINDNTKYFITGGGLSYIKGAKDVVGRILDKSVEILSPPLPQLSKPQYSSMLSILYTAINRKNSKMKI